MLSDKEMDNVFLTAASLQYFLDSEQYVLHDVSIKPLDQANTNTQSQTAASVKMMTFVSNDDNIYLYGPIVIDQQGDNPYTIKANNGIYNTTLQRFISTQQLTIQNHSINTTAGSAIVDYRHNTVNLANTVHTIFHPTK